MELLKEDYTLIRMAKDIIKKHYCYGKHHVGVALKTKSGHIYTAIHVKANVGRVSVCAEAVAIGMALANGDTAFDTIVAVKHPKPELEDQEPQVVSPCGLCRELISDYDATTKVIYIDNSLIKKDEIGFLLPAKFV